MELSKRALTSTAKKLAVTAAVAFAAMSADAYTLNVTDGTGTSTSSFNSATAFDAAGFASTDFGSLISFTLTGPAGTYSGTSVSPGNLFLSGANFAAGAYTVSIVGSAGGQYDAYFTTLTSAVPEPETYALFFAGLGAIGFLTRRRNNG